MIQRDARNPANQMVFPLWGHWRQHGVSESQCPPNAATACESAFKQAFVDGDFTQAIDILLHHYQDAMVSYCYSAFLDWHLAQEVAQEIFLAAFAGMVRFRGESSVKTWLYGIASKKCLEVGRTRVRRDALCRNHHACVRAPAHCDPPSEPEVLLEQAGQRQQVWQALHRMRVYDRELLVLRYLEELTCEEIASLLHVSRRTVERHLPRAEAKFCRAYQKVQKRPIYGTEHTAHETGAI